MNTLKFGNGEWYGKDGTILAYNDENNNYKPLPFTFDRDSVATRVNKQGLIETVGADQPRIDYLNDSKGALLLEPSRTNLVPYSEDFSQSVWSKTGLTVNENQILSPSGSLDADEVNITTANAHYLFDTISVSASTNYTFTFYVKKGTATDVSYSILNATNFTNIVNTTSYFNEISDTDWTRISVEFTTPSGCTSIRTYPLRDGSSTGNVYIWGAQLEEGYPTSIINTQGSAVTRLADVCNNGGNEQVINSTEGVLYAEISALDSSNIFDFGLYGNTSTNQCRIGFFNDDVYASLYNGSFQTQMSAPSNLSDFTKIAFKFSENDFALWIDGNEVATDTSGTTFNSGDLVKLNLSAQNGTSSLVTGNVKDVRVYDTALTDQELAALTQV